MYTPQKYTLVFLQGFNQRNNRIYRKYDDVLTYSELDGVKAYSEENVNFPIGDFLECDYPFGPMEIIPDYLLVGPGLIARYFVTKITHISGTQYMYHLVRDVLADYDTWLSDPAIIHRASEIPSTMDNSKYSKEMDLSQIKVGETLIKDRPDGRGWLVGYVSKDFLSGEGASTTISSTKDKVSTDAIIDDITEWQNKTFAEITSSSVSIGVNTFKSPNGIYYNRAWYIHGGTFGTGSANHEYQIYQQSHTLGFKEVNLSSLEDVLKTQLGLMLESLETSFKTSGAYSATSEALLEDGWLVLDKSTGKVYRVTDKQGTASVAPNCTFENRYGGKGIPDDFLTTFLNDTALWTGTGATFYTKAVTDFVVNWYTITAVTHSYTFTEVTDSSTTASVVLPSAPTDCSDSAFNIFAIPLGGNIDVNILSADGNISSTETINIDDAYSMAVAQAMIKTWKVDSSSASGLLDIQWLPYGPDSIFERASDQEGYRNYIYTGSDREKNHVGFVYWLPSCQLQKQITGEDYTIATPVDPMIARRSNETESYRLCSPNQASMFDFSAVKNNGVTGYNIDIAFKPFTPYICVAPIFAGLYGSNFDDGRGLILSGDFSLDQATKEWATYKYNNKNYELIFNRQIVSMDAENAYIARTAQQQLITDYLNIAGSSARGAGVGALVGAKSTGNFAGAIGGAVLGAGTSLANGIINTSFDRENIGTEANLRALKRRDSIAQYQYQLGNIKARSDTVTKISSFNPNFKIYPVLEHYMCTAEDMSNYDNGVHWNGINLEKFGELNQFSMDGTFVQATLLRDTTIPPQIFEAINDELELGIYLYGSTSLSGDEEEST